MPTYQLMLLAVLFMALLSFLEWKISIERKEWAEEQKKEPSLLRTREQELEDEVARLLKENEKLAQENNKQGFR